MNRIAVFLSMATMLVALSAPLSAQSVTLKANVPFEFTVSGHSMPAGDYTVASVGGRLTIRVSGGHSDVTALVNYAETKPTGRSGKSLLIFHRVGDQYFLSSVVSGSSASSLDLPVSRTEKELAKTASLGDYETVAILASL